MRHFIDTFLEPALWFAADWSLRWAALLVVAALILWIFRPRRAAIREMILKAALLAGLLLPFAPRWGDGWEWLQLQEPPPSPSFPRSAWERTPGRSASRPSQVPDATQSVAPVRSHAERGNEKEQSSETLGHRRFILLGLVSFWSLAVAYQLIRSLCGWIFLRQLRSESRDAIGATADLFAACRAELHVGKAVQLAIHPHVFSPILIGWLRPRILVPLDWPQRNAEEQRAGLLHELSHIHRRDHLLVPLLEIIRIAFFFHPFVRWLLARLEHERELLCDEMVVRLGIDRRAYARLLLEYARSSGRLAWPAVSLPMSRRRTVKGRIHHLLEEDMERWIRPLPARWAVALGGGLLVLSLGLASYRVWAQEKEITEALVKNTEHKATADKPAPSPLKREDLRYGGKDFYEWRRDLLTELKGSIRVDGIRAFAAFGVNGYGTEATKAILEIMRGYDVTEIDYMNQSEDDSAVMRAGIQAISKIGASALPALTQAVEGKNRNVRLFAIQALEWLREDALPAVPILLQTMKNEDLATRSCAREAVRAIDPNAKGFVPALIAALKDDVASIRSIAAARLREEPMVKNAKSAIPALLDLLQDKVPVVRLEAIQTLNSIGPEKQGVLVVSKLLDDKDWKITTGAYSFLQSLGSDAKDAVPALLAVLNQKHDGDWRVIETLGAIGPAAKDAIPQLTELLQSDQANIRNQAMNALKKIRPGGKR